MDYKPLIALKASQYGVPPELALAVAARESGYNPAARSPKGAIGLFQLMPATAAELGVNPHDPLANIDGGLRYLRQQYDTFKSWPLALAAYNAGPGNVRKYGGVPPFQETQQYVSAIMARSGLDAAPAGGGAAPPVQLASMLPALPELPFEAWVGLAAAGVAVFVFSSSRR